MDRAPHDVEVDGQLAMRKNGDRPRFRNRETVVCPQLLKGDAVELEQATWAVQQAAVFVNAMRAGFMPGAGSIDEA